VEDGTRESWPRMFKRGQVYTHKNFRDVNIFVRKEPSIRPSINEPGIRIDVIWLTKQGSILAEDDLFIAEHDFKEWSNVTEDKVSSEPFKSGDLNATED
jgi:hypothetical protein